ncbi:hypothetical protein, partial [Staphylococcus saprophyticus]|uniref:hypothetical protein n=1 Tax=Staphylococcus saprophyticus TaxID=29385 RepID=UPI001C92D1C8
NKLIVRMILVSVVKVNGEYFNSSIVKIGRRIVSCVMRNGIIKITGNIKEMSRIGEVEVLLRG